MLNHVELIGKCISIQPDKIELLMRTGDVFTVYLQEKIDVNIIEVNSFTRIIGRIAYINDIPFINIVADKVYQLKNNQEYTN